MQGKGNTQEEWHPPMKKEPVEKSSHPPELRYQEDSLHNPTRMYISSIRNSKLQLYDPIIRDVLCEAMTTMDDRITCLEKRMCFFESSGAILQKQHMNAEELAKYLGYTKCAIYNLTRRRQIPFHKHKRHIFFDKKEIDDWIRSCKPTKWDELGVKPESVPIDLNEAMEQMKQRAEEDSDDDNNEHKQNINNKIKKQ